MSSLNRKITQNKTKHLLNENKLATIKNKIPDVSSLVKKTNYNTKIAEIDTKVSNPDGKIDKNILHTAKAIGLFSLGNSMFDEEDGFQAYLTFQPVHKYFKFITNTNYISSRKSKGLSAESIKPFPTSDNSLTPLLVYYDCDIWVKFNGSVLRQPKVTYTHGKVVNIYTVYEFGESSSNDNDATSKNCLFGAVTLTKNADIDKYGYSGYGIGFDRRSSFSFPGGGFGQNVLIFGADMSSSAHIDNKKRHISSRKRTNARIRKYFNCKKNVFYQFCSNKKEILFKFVFNGVNSYLFVNSKEIVKFKAKDSEIVATPLCLGNISKDCSVDEKTNTVLNGYVCDFSVDYDAISVADILGITHKYLMKKMRYL